LWWAFGEHDGVFLLEAPDDVAAVALAMAVGASGQVSTETIALLDMNEAQEAMRRDARPVIPLGYREVAAARSGAIRLCGSGRRLGHPALPPARGDSGRVLGE
jgi:GYD domain